MQRCPTCEFVYEEGQLICDMDGSQLVYDPHELPQNLPAVRSKRRGRSVPRLIGIVAIPNFLLAGLLFYGTTQQEAQTATGLPPIPATQSQNSSPTELSEQGSVATDNTADASENAQPGNNEESTDQLTATPTSKTSTPAVVGTEPSPGEGVEPSQPADRGTTTPARSTGIKPRTTAPRDNSQRNAHQKKDSKVGSLIKKTKSFLKRPFKF